MNQRLRLTCARNTHPQPRFTRFRAAVCTAKPVVQFVDTRRDAEAIIPVVRTAFQLTAVEVAEHAVVLGILDSEVGDFFGRSDEDVIRLFLVTQVVGVGDAVVGVQEFHLADVRLQRRYERRYIFIRHVNVAYVLDQLQNTFVVEERLLQLTNRRDAPGLRVTFGHQFPNLLFGFDLKVRKAQILFQYIKHRALTHGRRKQLGDEA